MAGRLITVLQAVSDASMEIGIAQMPLSQAIGSKDQDVAQLASLLTAVADEVLLDEPYEEALGDGFWLLDKDGKPQSRPTGDDNIILFDGRLAIIGLKWRFLAAKGLEFGEQQRDFIIRQNKLAGRRIGRVLDLYADEERLL